MQKFLTHIHFFIWAAMHSRTFCHDEILVISPLRLRTTSYGFTHWYFYFEICKPKIEISLSTLSVGEYEEAMKVEGKKYYISPEVLLEDIPF